MALVYFHCKSFIRYSFMGTSEQREKLALSCCLKADGCTQALKAAKPSIPITCTMFLSKTSTSCSFKKAGGNPQMSAFLWLQGNWVIEYVMTQSTKEFFHNG